MMVMHVDFQTLSRLLPYVVKARKPILIRGPHGIGKSEIVYQLKDKVASILGLDKNYIYPVVERRASQMADAGDLMGLPQLDGEVTKFLPMAWFHQACVQPCILFLDEVDRGCQDVRQSIFELTDSRKIAGHSLHPDTIIVACVNGGQGDNQYQVGEMDPAELSRWTVFDVRPSLEDWLSYAKDKIANEIWDFIKQNPSFLEHSGEFEPNKVYPCRRSWFRLDEACKDSTLLEGTNLDLLYLAQGFIGAEAATSFLDFCKNYDRQVTVEDLFINGRFDKVKDFEINQHMAMIDKIGEHKLASEKMSDQVVANLAHYIFTIPAELVMKLWEVVSTKNSDNGIALFQAEVNEQSVSNYIAELNGAVSSEK